MSVSVKRRGNGDFPRIYRPKTFSEIIDTFNKESFIKYINSKDRPNSYLFYGLSGAGKTTLAYIFSYYINCENPQNSEPCLQCSSCKSISDGCPDILDLNLGDKRKLDDARAIIEKASYNPLLLKYKVFILDEAQQMDKYAQNALLKKIENSSKKMFYILCTTEPNKLIVALKRRCTAQYMFKGLSEQQKRDLITAVLKIETGEAKEEDIKYIMPKIADNSPSNILSATQTFLAGGLTEQFTEDSKQDIKDIVKKIMNNDLSFLKDLKYVKQISDENDCEGFRIGIASYLGAVLKNAVHPAQRFQTADALNYLTQPYYGNDIKNRLTYNLYKAACAYGDKR